MLRQVPAKDSIPDLLRRSAQVRQELEKSMESLQQTLRISSDLVLPASRAKARYAAPRQAPVPVGLLDELTPREVEVLRLIAEGLSTKELAAKLNICFKTAVCHRSRILQKLNLHETVSLVRLAIRAGLIEP